MIKTRDLYSISILNISTTEIRNINIISEKGKKFLKIRKTKNKNLTSAIRGEQSLLLAFH